MKTVPVFSRGGFFHVISAWTSGKVQAICGGLMFSRFVQRRFSLMLALRYLNPLRTYFSVITIICLVGVAIGIAVLMVTLSVMEGLQRDIKSRVLAYSPHVTISYVDGEGRLPPMKNWREVVEEMKKTPGVETAYPKLEEYTLAEGLYSRKPCSFQAVDTENEEQMKQLEELLDSGSADMGMGEEAIISKSMADSMHVQVGDTIRLYSTKNFDEVIQAYKKSEHSLKKQQKDKLEEISHLWDGGEEKEGLEWISSLKVEEVANVLFTWQEMQYIRESEYELVSSLLTLLGNPSTKAGGKEGYLPGSGKAYKAVIQKIQTLDTDKEDLEALKGVEQILLPRDLEVIGIYLSSRHVASPDIFIPLNLGQELLDFTDPVAGGYMDAAQGVAVRVKDPYVLAPVEQAIRDHLPPVPDEGGGYYVRNWMQNPIMTSWVDLMQKERMLLSFVLFFIMLISAFCIMAVMFAMSIQRKKEIAVMRALGATPRQVIHVFLWQGIIIGIIGCLLGVGLGRLTLHYRMQIWSALNFMNIDIFPQNFHGVPTIPCHILVSDIVMITIVSFILVVCASIIPAILTSRQDPAKSLRSL